MSVLDTSATVDYLLATGAGDQVAQLLKESPPPCAPDVMVFEVLAVLRRHALRGVISGHRATAALRDLGAMPIAWFPSMPLRLRAFELRENVGPADAIFVALAEDLGERLVTKDAGLAAAVTQLGQIEVRQLRDWPSEDP